MREKRKEQYLPLTFRDRLLDELAHIRQGSMTVADYQAKLDELTLRADVEEDERITLYRFRSGRRQEIQRELRPHMALEQAYQVAMEVEASLKVRGPVSQSGGSSTFRRPTGPTRPTITPTSGPRATDNRGKTPMSQTTPKKDPAGVQCFNCQSLGHYSYQCPKKALIVEHADNEASEGQEENEVWEPEGETSENEGTPEGNPLEVMRCILTTPQTDDDWRRTTIFYSYSISENKTAKLVIDGGSSLHVVSKTAIPYLGLEPEPHPHPYRVAWVDKTTIPVTERCLVPITMGGYHERVWCDVLPMDVAKILLGRPWIYDHDVTHYGKNNTYVFRHNGKTMTLMPIRPKEVTSGKTKEAPKPRGQSLVILTRKKFEEESQDSGVVYAVVARAVPDDSTLVVPSEIQRVLSEYPSIMPEELPDTLPPLRDIQRAIDLVPGAPLPNLPHYRMGPSEHEELRRQVNDLLKKGFVRESLSACAVQALLTGWHLAHVCRQPRHKQNHCQIQISHSET